MSTPSTRWIPIAAAAAGLALAAAAVPAVAATTAASPVTYYGCVTTRTGAIKIVSGTTTCATGQHKISWNHTGPAGPAGPAGLPGPKGDTGPQGPPGVTDGYTSSSPDASNIGFSGLTTVGTLKLPAGSFLVTATATASIIQGEPTDNIFCVLADGAGNRIDYTGVTTNTGTFGDGAADVAMTAATTVGLTMTLQCQDALNEAYMANINFTAIPVAAIING